MIARFASVTTATRGNPGDRIARLTTGLRGLGYNVECAALIAYRYAYGRTLFPNEQADANTIDAADKLARGIL